MSVFITQNSSNTILLSNSKTLSANNTTANVAVFGITGTVRFLKLYAVVTTVIGANHTGGYFNLYDQTARTNITLNTGGITLSALVAGTWFGKVGLAGAVGTVKSAATGLLIEPTTLETFEFSEFVAIKKNTAVTEVDYTYSTTDTPTSGVLQFFAEYQPISADGSLSAL